MTGIELSLIGVTSEDLTLFILVIGLTMLGYLGAYLTRRLMG